ncbi:IS3 family transposase [Salimicrobium flavidum]|uniref:IS3 family transposase n=1 Tax=Salimicrobium flavidum TaxID=570947 RepID=UPI0009FFF88E
MKDGIAFRACPSLAEIQQAIDEYLKYYNNDQHQRSLQRLTPVQYRSHLIVA